LDGRRTASFGFGVSYVGFEEVLAGFSAFSGLDGLVKENISFKVFFLGRTGSSSSFLSLFLSFFGSDFF
jgi:hypothetical protein